MKTNVDRRINLLSLCILMALIFTGIYSCTGQKPNDKVFAAFELRMNGHADSAKVILENITADYPENAMAWFELCRTTQHLGLSNPREIKSSIDNALKYINLAVENAPGNVYFLSYKGKIETLHFYMALQTGDEKAPEYLAKVEDTFKNVFEMDKTYPEDKITLVEFFAGLPPEMGGNREKAEKYAAELEKDDLVAGAKAREILMDENADYESFWKKIIEKAPNNADALQALGRVYLFSDDINQAAEYFQKAINLDASKNTLYLDLGRYYLMMAMQNPAILDSVAPLIEVQYNKFLSSVPEPVKPLKAWAYGNLSMVAEHSRNISKSEEFLAQAKESDPFFSMAFGKPSKALFSQPDVVLHEQDYYLSPF